MKRRAITNEWKSRVYTFKKNKYNILLDKYWQIILKYLKNINIVEKMVLEQQSSADLTAMQIIKMNKLKITFEVIFARDDCWWSCSCLQLEQLMSRRNADMLLGMPLTFAQQRQVSLLFLPINETVMEQKCTVWLYGLFSNSQITGNWMVWLDTIFQRSW